MNSMAKGLQGGEMINNVQCNNVEFGGLMDIFICKVQFLTHGFQRFNCCLNNCLTLLQTFTKVA